MSDWSDNWFMMSWGGGEEVRRWVGVWHQWLTAVSFPLEVCAVAAVPLLPGGSGGQNCCIPAAHALPWPGCIWSSEDDPEDWELQPRSDLNLSVCRRCSGFVEEFSIWAFLCIGNEHFCWLAISKCSFYHWSLSYLRPLHLQLRHKLFYLFYYLLPALLVILCHFKTHILKC